jgi:hypothetical protein
MFSSDIKGTYSRKVSTIKMALLQRLREIIGKLAQIKANHFSIDDAVNRRLIIFTRLSEIQKNLVYLCGLVESVKMEAKIRKEKGIFNDEEKIFIQNLELATAALKSKPFDKLIPGDSPLAADLFCLNLLVSKKSKNKIVNRYLDALSAYLLTLITYYGEKC